jgi:DNA modification methylase
MGLKRNYIGIELSPDYCKLSEERLVRNAIRSEVIGSRQQPLFMETM